jgi:hypothetical protein
MGQVFGPSAQQIIATIVDSAPATLDTLKEIADSINDDANFAVTVTNDLALKAPLASPSFTGTTAIQQVLEKITISNTQANTTVNYDLLSNGSITYYTGEAAGNWTLNIRGNSGTTLNSLMAINQSLTIAFLVTNGSTARYQTALQVDGASVSPKWQGGSAPTSGNASSIDVYSVTIIKTANATFTALESQTKFA